MPIIYFSVGDILVLKKKHPCSCDEFKVMRGGSDVRIICTGCGRDLTVQREKLEKMIKKVISDKKENPS
ncbi:MAG: DUF951 domain-containing protein [Ruminococcaceae bacterium]|nr:DUF951 domain-containing protein [Oscillospiraceae bacterium]